MAVTYIVEGYTITGGEIDTVRRLNYKQVVLELDLPSPNSRNINLLKIKVLDSANNVIHDFLLDNNRKTTKPVKLKANRYTKRDIKITKEMIDEIFTELDEGASIPLRVMSLKCTPRRYTHFERGHADHRLDFIGYRVFIEREPQ